VERGVIVRSSIVVVVALGVVFALGSAPAEEIVAAEGVPRVQIRNTDNCPVKILPRKSRVVDPDELLDRGEGSLAAQEMYKRKFFGATERQVIYDVVFRNDSEQELLSVAFVWTAFDEAGKRVYQRLSHYGSAPLAPGRIHALHDLDVMIAREVERYELSVFGAEFADGSLCVAKPDDLAER
jgi:hypothetical protein